MLILSLPCMFRISVCPPTLPCPIESIPTARARKKVSSGSRRTAVRQPNLTFSRFRRTYSGSDIGWGYYSRRIPFLAVFFVWHLVPVLAFKYPPRYCRDTRVHSPPARCFPFNSVVALILPGESRVSLYETHGALPPMDSVHACTHRRAFDYTVVLVCIPPRV